MLLALRSSIKYEIGAAHGKLLTKKIIKTIKCFIAKNAVKKKTANLGHDKETSNWMCSGNLHLEAAS